MRILFCSHTYPPDRGGVAAFARDMVGLLRRAGHDVRVLYDVRGQDPDYRRAGRFLKRLSNPRFRAWAGTLLRAVRVVDTLMEFRPQAVICSTWLHYGLIVRLLAPLLGYRLIIQIHGYEIVGRFRYGWRQRVMQATLRSAYSLWPNSSHTAELLWQYGCKDERMQIVPPFLPEEALQAAASNTDAVLEQPPLILTAANLYPLKGIDLVLRALARLEDLSWQYVVVGESPLLWPSRIYEKMARDLGIGGRVVFLDKMPREELWALMARAHVFVMTSRVLKDHVESFGIVYIEAQLFGLPCIGTRLGGIPEAVQDGVTGILIENEDVEGLVDTLRWMLCNPREAAQMGQRGRMRVLKSFTEEVRRQQLMPLLERMSEERSTRQPVLHRDGCCQQGE